MFEFHTKRMGFLFLIFSLIHLASCTPEIRVSGLTEPVKVIRDQNGINHIYAADEEDLFFAQGYLAAKDRLFQFEIWRRQATGTLAEILGERELDRDIGARLFKFRGDKKTELNHYHPRGEAIVDAFVQGVNAYIDEALSKPENLPIEFQMLDILPRHWTWEVVISRHQGLLQNAKQELNYSRVVALLGPEKTKQLFHFHPFEPNLELSASIPKELLFKDIIAPYDAFRNAVNFAPSDLKEPFRNDEVSFLENQKNIAFEQEMIERIDASSIGSNNWVVNGNLSQSGFPIMANDPHRAHAVPSLRYWVHLHAPGWNMVGGGEPVIPGVSIGHNEYGAWGLTIFQTDSEDIRIYDLHPEDPTQYRYKGEWVKMKTIADTIQVKGGENKAITHHYTLHGPVTFIDHEANKAVAIECAWLEPGGAPYLASLRMGQAENWEEFREACRYNHIPAENMVWADREGNIGWQATGIAPLRRGFSGLVVTSGDGSQDWDGYLPMLDRPSAYNPESGFIVTANENLVDSSYSYSEALGYTWADPFRGDRIREVLSSGRKFTVEDMGNLQNDYLSLPARVLVQELVKLNLSDEKSLKAQSILSDWDYVLAPNSVAAGIYVMWERKIRSNLASLIIPDIAKPYVSELNMTKAIQWIQNNDSEVLGSKDKETLLAQSLIEAIASLEERLGDDWDGWHYGQEKYKHALIRHPLSAAVSAEWRERLNIGPAPRGGYSFTPGANAYGDNNTTGASFRIVVDTGDWEKTIGANNPGQSGDHGSVFYKNMFDLWAEDKFFSVKFTDKEVEKMAYETYFLR